MPSVIENVRIAGIAAAVPKDNYPILKELGYGTEEDRLKFIKTTGIENRRISNATQCTSDFAFSAAEALIERLDWDRSEIEVLILVTQSPDYILPSTAIVLQQRLGLSHHCAAFDINLGCSGYTYGLSVMGSMVSAGKMKKGLLLVGDTSGKGVVPSVERGVAPLFGDAGTATALEWCEGAPPMYSDLCSDGSGYQAIMHYYGGSRNPFPAETFKYEISDDGLVMIDTKFNLDGLEIFNFSIREVPPAIRGILEFSGRTIEDVDAFVFHQANRLMNEMIRKNLKIPAEKVPYTFKEYGNTSSATIPLTMAEKLREPLESSRMTFVMCGFGVGLSWGTILCETDNIVCLPVLSV